MRKQAPANGTAPSFVSCHPATCSTRLTIEKQARKRTFLSWPPVIISSRLSRTVARNLSDVIGGPSFTQQICSTEANPRCYQGSIRGLRPAAVLWYLELSCVSRRMDQWSSHQQRALLLMTMFIVDRVAMKVRMETNEGIAWSLYEHFARIGRLDCEQSLSKTSNLLSTPLMPRRRVALPGGPCHQTGRSTSEDVKDVLRSECQSTSTSWVWSWQRSWEK